MTVQKQHLQGVVNDDELTPLLPLDQVALVQSRRNRPLYVIRRLESLVLEQLGERYRSGQIDASMPKYIEKHFIEALNSLVVHLTACERILKQPVPLSYSRHTSRFLSLYMFLLPFSLVGPLGWATIPVVTAVTWSLVGIQEIAHFIEEPFDRRTQIIPLNQFASLVRVDSSELLDGVLEGAEMDEIDEILLQETLQYSRGGGPNEMRYYNL